MTRRFCIVAGAALVLALNALFLVVLVVKGMVQDWKNGNKN